MDIPKTEGKNCIDGAKVEVMPNGGSLFKEISTCGNHCTKYIPEYKCCIDILYKYIKVKESLH